MSEFLLFWAISFIISQVIEVKFSMDLIKDFAEEGYKINIKNIREFASNNEKINKLRDILLMIPLVNIAIAINYAVQLNNNKFETMNLYSVTGIVDRFSSEEEKRYNEDPSPINAFFIANESEEKKNSEKILNVKLDYTILVLEDGTTIKYQGLLIDTEPEIEIVENPNSKSKEDIGKEALIFFSILFRLNDNDLKKILKFENNYLTIYMEDLKKLKKFNYIFDYFNNMNREEMLNFLYQEKEKLTIQNDETFQRKKKFNKPFNISF